MSIHEKKQSKTYAAELDAGITARGDLAHLLAVENRKTAARRLRDARGIRGRVVRQAPAVRDTVGHC